MTSLTSGTKPVAQLYCSAQPSVLSQTYSIIIDRGISSLGHGKEVVYGLNAVDKRYIYLLMSKVQLPGSVRFDSQIKMHTGTENKDVSLAK